MSEAVTEDALLGGAVRLRQPARGYRAAIDPVLLAAAVPAAAGEAVLDVGTGTGAAALCLARRVAGCHVDGFDTQREFVALAGVNVELNRLAERVRIYHGDLKRPPPRLAPASFSHVMANPPHLAAERTASSPDHGKAVARVEGAADLAAWVRFSLTMLRPGGTFTLIHRADRLDELLSLLRGRAGELVIFPLWPGRGRPAKRVILRGRRNIATPLTLAPGLVLHQADGAFTAEADAVLRGGEALALL